MKYIDFCKGQISRHYEGRCLRGPADLTRVTLPDELTVLLLCDSVSKPTTRLTQEAKFCKSLLTTGREEASDERPPPEKQRNIISGLLHIHIAINL